MKEGRLIRWLKEVGDPVEKDEPVMEIETDKITMEAEAPRFRDSAGENRGGGYLGARAVGDRLHRGAGRKDSRGSGSQPQSTGALSAGGSAAAVSSPAAQRNPPPWPRRRKRAGRLRPGRPRKERLPPSREPEAEPVRSVCGQSYSCHALREESRPGKGTGFKGHCSRQKRRRYPAPPTLLATPLARRIAQDQGVDLSAVAGTGCHGKVTKGDVLAAAQSSGAGFAAVQAVKADITCLLDLISQLNGSREKALSLDAFFPKGRRFGGPEAVPLLRRL